MIVLIFIASAILGLIALAIVVSFGTWADETASIAELEAEEEFEDVQG